MKTTAYDLIDLDGIYGGPIECNYTLVPSMRFAKDRSTQKGSMETTRFDPINLMRKIYRVEAVLGLHRDPAIQHQGRSFGLDPMISKLKSPNLLIRASDNGLRGIEAIHIRTPDRDRPSFLHDKLGLGEIAFGIFRDEL